MKPFESDALFWLPENPSEVVGGRLKCGADGGTEVSLTGGLGGNRGSGLQKRHHVLHGVAESLPEGRAFTLWDAMIVGQSFAGPGYASEQYRPKALLTGSHLPAESETRFKSCGIRLEGLEEWARPLTGLNKAKPVGGGQRFTAGIDYTKPDGITARCGDAELELGVFTSIREGWREYRIKERVEIGVTISVEANVRTLFDRFVYPIQNLITLAMDAPSDLLKFTVFTKEDSGFPGFVGVYLPLVSARTKVDRRASDRLLFGLEDVGVERFRSLLPSWLDISTRFREVCNIFFGLQYNQETFVEGKLEAALHAVTLYGLKVGAADRPEPDESLQAAYNLLPINLREHVRKLLSTSPIISTDMALRGLMADHGEEVEWLHRGNRTAFVGKVLNTMNYLQGREPLSSLASSTGLELFKLMLQVSWLMKLCFLKELGFTKQERQSLLYRSRDAQFARETIASDDGK